MKKFTRLLVALAIGCSAINLSAQDSTPPAIQAVSPSAGATVGSLLQVTVTFSEPVVNVAASDLLANGVPAISLAGSGASYTFVLEEEPTLGLVQITWDPSHDIRDLSPAANRFNENGPSATWQYTLFDGTAPTVTGLEPAPGVGIRSLTQVEVTFNEAVVGVEAGDLLINATPATGLQILGVGRYRFTFAQPVSGSVQVQWAGNHQIRDLAVVPNNFGGGSWSYQLDPNLGVPAIRINEFVSGNVSGLLDENGEAQDWIEIWNYGSVDVNLAGYSLTDDAEDPGRWTFPSTNLAPGQFLVVFASGKDRKSPATSALRLHTNFRLGTESEYLGLYNAESPRVVVSDFAPEYPTQRNNTSYGPDDAGQLKYFATPTAGGPNGQSAISAALVPPHFNVERGTFDNPIK
ncbi:MAG TPA: lamin tail domain-containing protein, partial [Verrucomicrobiae bacterium]|nr:lamin tail domain-containing protein [Verrucomicrobiae bacterium]